MDINPTSKQGSPRKPDAATLESARAEEARKAGSAEHREAKAKEAAPRKDSVEVSAEAKALAEQTEARPAKSSLPPDRLKAIGERLASGHYDRPEVIDQVARRLAKDPDFLG